MPDWSLLLVNLGTPDAPDTPAVRRYLREFLSDPRVVDLPAPARFALVNGIIAPFRSPKSAHAYRQIWTDEGSPLLVHGRSLAAKVAARLGDEAHVELAMRYGNPSLADGLARCLEASHGPVVVFPLFPQYASATTGSALEAVYRAAAAGPVVPSLRVVPEFYDHPAFVDAAAAVARTPLDDFGADRVLLSFHGLPERQLAACVPAGSPCGRAADCCDVVGPANLRCYRAHCFATARALAERLGLPDDGYEVTFQSRLGRTPWVRPYTDERVRALAADGVRRLAVLTPSFVADCLETLEEIAIRVRDDFRAHGGEDLALIPCVNDADPWADGVVRLARAARGGHNARPPGSPTAGDAER